MELPQENFLSLVRITRRSVLSLSKGQAYDPLFCYSTRQATLGLVLIDDIR